jgi:hypothetical protein
MLVHPQRLQLSKKVLPQVFKNSDTAQIDIPQ